MRIRNITRRSRHRRIPVLMGGIPFINFLDNIDGTKWWHGQELTGTTIVNTDTALNGVYSAVALAQPAQGNLGLGVSYDGGVSFGNIYTAALNTFFNRNTGSLIAFVRASGAGVWTDGATRRIVQFLVDGGNRLFISKVAANNTIEFQYRANAVSESIVIGAITSIDYLQLVMTWDTTGNLIAYINGAVVGVPQAIANTIVGPLGITQTLIGALSTAPTNVWDGDADHIGIANRVLPATEILDIWNRSGLI